MNQETCWTIVRAAAAGNADARAEFTRHYLDVVRGTISARWRGSRFKQEIDDAVQEVFVECFREGGAIERVDPKRSGGFRAYLYGVIQNVAGRVEGRHARSTRRREKESFHASELAANETRISQVFDREWARAIMQQAGELQEARAKQTGAAAERRVQILRLHFEEGLPVREIADRLGLESDVTHHEYARARKEFKATLREVVAFHCAGTAGEIERECAQLLDLLKR